MIKARLKQFIQSDGFIIIIGAIAGLLLLSNLLFNSFILLKQNMVVQRDIERIEKFEDQLINIEMELEQLRNQQEVK